MWLRFLLTVQTTRFCARRKAIRYVAIVAEYIAQNLMRMLAQGRRRRTYRCRRAGEFHRNAEHLHRAGSWMRHSLDHGARTRVAGAAKACATVLIRPQGMPPAFSFSIHDQRRPANASSINHRRARRDFPPARCWSRSARRPPTPDGPTQAASFRELAIIADRDGDHLIGGAIGRVRHDTRMTVAVAPRVFARNQMAGGHVGQHGKRVRTATPRPSGPCRCVPRVQRRQHGVTPACRCRHRRWRRRI